MIYKLCSCDGRCYTLRSNCDQKFGKRQNNVSCSVNKLGYNAHGD